VATDDELYEIGGEAWNDADRNGEEPYAAERRALYEAGRQAAARVIREFNARIAEGKADD